MSPACCRTGRRWHPSGDVLTTTPRPAPESINSLPASSAQLNAFEAFPLFAAAVIIAHLAGGRQATIDLLAVAFVSFRIIYTLAYLYDRPLLRSLVWSAALFCVIGRFVAAA